MIRCNVIIICISFFELISIRGGRFLEVPLRGNRRFTINGFEARTGGLFKLLATLFDENESGSLLPFLLKHVDFRYNHSEIVTDEYSKTLDNTKFDSYNLIISN